VLPGVLVEVNGDMGLNSFVSSVLPRRIFDVAAPAAASSVTGAETGMESVWCSPNPKK
jgi:hypothetical protein